MFMHFRLEARLLSEQQSGGNSYPRQILVNWFGNLLYHSVKKRLFMNCKMSLSLFCITLEKPLRCFMSSFAYILNGNNCL